jgi:Papain family cysteine protease
LQPLIEICCGISSYCDSEQRVTCEEKVCLVTEKMINTVNSVSSLGWTAGNYSGFWGRTLDEGLSRRLGTFEPVMTRNMLKQKKKSIQLPSHFNAVDKWPKFVKDVKDQGWCGCSWAMSTASVASDRFSIHSKGVENVDLSPQNLLSCDTNGQHGCSGGHVDKAWSYFRHSG